MQAVPCNAGGTRASRTGSNTAVWHQHGTSKRPLCAGLHPFGPPQSGRFDVPCWCQAVAFEPALLTRVPPALQGTACICPRCAGAPMAAQTSGADAVP